MNGNKANSPAAPGRIRSLYRRHFSQVPFLGWLVGGLAAVLLERWFGAPLARSIGLPKVPVLFGLVTVLKNTELIPSTLLYVLLIYAVPLGVVARLTPRPLNALAAFLFRFPLILPLVVHTGLLYAVLHIWAEVSDYRVLTLKLTLIAVLITLSLNVINGYMGEFSCSHPGFMALGAYVGSVFTVLLFSTDKIFGPPLLNPALGPFFFPLALFLGGAAAALGALVIAIPSFRTRGDYLAIISLAFLFIVKSAIENLEVVGGPRGLSGQPDYAALPVVFTVVMLGLWIINNFVNSTLGKALNAVRDNEGAADAMTVNTRQTKIRAFMFAAFWAGVAGALFAHVLRYVNPGTFGIQKLAEVLAMVYFGGLNSVYGSIVGAVSISLLEEALRPLEIYKWIIIPLLLILVMIFRPTGLIAFKQMDLRQILRPRDGGKGEV